MIDKDEFAEAMTKAHRLIDEHRPPSAKDAVTDAIKQIEKLDLNFSEGATILISELDAIEYKLKDGQQFAGCKIIVTKGFV